MGKFIISLVKAFFGFLLVLIMMAIGAIGLLIAIPVIMYRNSQRRRTMHKDDDVIDVDGSYFEEAVTEKESVIDKGVWGSNKLDG